MTHEPTNQTQHTYFNLLIFAEFDYIIGDVNIMCIRHLHDLFQTPEQIWDDFSWRQTLQIVMYSIVLNYWTRFIWGEERIKKGMKNRKTELK